MKFKVFLVVLLIALSSCKKENKASKVDATEQSSKVSSITNKEPYNPKPGMEKLERESKDENIHFLVFGDSKGSDKLPSVLKIADVLSPQFCITTADLVNKGGGEIGENLYKELDKDAGWFFRKYPTWPTIGNHEISGPKTTTRKENYTSGVKNFGDFFGLKDPFYSFTYRNAKFIALDWIKVSESPERLEWLENELKEAQGKHIFIFKHRPYYTVGQKDYDDVEGKPTVATKLFTKYKVDAVFSGHDHIYYRTLRDGVNYIVSAGAGAGIYKLKREGDALPEDAYYGKIPTTDPEEYKFHAASGEETKLNAPMFYVVSVKIDGDTVNFEMIDTNGEIWDQFTFESKKQ